MLPTVTGRAAGYSLPFACPSCLTPDCAETNTNPVSTASEKNPRKACSEIITKQSIPTCCNHKATTSATRGFFEINYWNFSSNLLTVPWTGPKSPNRCKDPAVFACTGTQPLFTAAATQNAT